MAENLDTASPKITNGDLHSGTITQSVEVKREREERERAKHWIWEFVCPAL